MVFVNRKLNAYLFLANEVVMQKSYFAICELPCTERPREKSLQYGMHSLSDGELLAIIIGSGGKGHSALDLAKTLLAKFGNLRNLAQVSSGELQKISGIGPVKALEIKACLEIARRFHQVALKPGVFLTGSQQIFDYYHEKLRDQRKEQFYSVLLDVKHRIIREELVSIGSLNFSIVHPREVFAPAIREAAGSILLIHNHPSGDPTPSMEDIETTKRLIEVGKVVGIRILDHIIIGNGCYISFLEQKLP